MNTKAMIYIMITALILGFGSNALALTIDFEDYTTGTASVQITSDYKGFSWNEDFGVTSIDHLRSAYGYGDDFKLPSGDYVAFNWWGTDRAVLTSTEDFNFSGASFSTWADDGDYASWSAPAISIEGYNDGTFVGSTEVVELGLDFISVSADLNGVDEIRILLSFASDEETGPGYWLMDDLKYSPVATREFTEDETHSVPEPASIFLFGLGAFGLLVFGKKRNT